ncbi:DUF397 domain-containing protein [Streptomyces sp. NPDC048057]|uniref:DUF397 domain-containing protein n=1 Tax=Streptomyces sp. NPDC048057 TaxID=3155628 RepID=UPI0034028269
MSTPRTHGPWRKSSYSAANGNCVEVAPAGTYGMAVRDSKDLGAGQQTYSAVQWSTFVNALRSGELG